MKLCDFINYCVFAFFTFSVAWGQTPQGPKITLQSANATDGLSGTVKSADGQTAITFKSIKISGDLNASIQDSSGNSLITYTESLLSTARRYNRDGTFTEELKPVLQIGALKYSVWDDAMAAEFNTLVARPEAELIRALALLLPVTISVGEELKDERRGLQVGYQAMQDVFTTEPQWWAITASQLDRLPALKRAPSDCAIPYCTVVETADYLLSKDGGFTIKTLSPRLVLRHNYATGSITDALSQNASVGSPFGSRAPRDSNSIALSPKDIPSTYLTGPQPSLVGDCLGRCGAGCGSWSFNATGAPQIASGEYRCEAPSGGACSPLVACDTNLLRVDYIHSYGLWTTTGKVTVSCQLHDDCVRGAPLGLLDPICQTFLPTATADYISGAGVSTTWQHYGWGYAYPGVTVLQYNSSQCNGASPNYPWY